jgi:DNA primase small subunit
MEESILSKTPEKVDIGAVYNIKPKDSKNIGLVAFRAEERELVFDIDMTDYDDIRTCCKGADICLNCWPFMIIAAKILNRALREDFGFKDLLWVYSGRRGIHCWVADQRARKLGTDGRSAVAEYLSLIEGGEFKAKKVSFDGNNSLHPSVVSALHIIDQYFNSLLLEKQKVLETKEQIQSVIDLCNDPELKKQLNSELYDKKYKNSIHRWERLQQLSQNHFSNSVRIKSKQQNRHFVDELKLQFCYPRLDIHVTKGLNHLLKTPFSVHPKTGRICVPIDFKEIDSFDPFKVPDVSSLCAQIDENTSANNRNNKVYENTDLLKSIKLFQAFIQNIESDFKGLMIKKSDEKMEF